MQLSDFGSLSELIRSVAVIATLIYVGLQIRENSSWIKQQALDSVVDRFTTWGARLRDNPEVLDLYLRGAQEFASFDRADRHRFHLTKLEIVAAIETVLEHSKSDMIKVEADNAAHRRLAQELAGPGTRVWWEEMGRASFSDDLGALIDQLLASSLVAATDTPDASRV